MFWFGIWKICPNIPFLWTMFLKYIPPFWAPWLLRVLQETQTSISKPPATIYCGREISYPDRDNFHATTNIIAYRLHKLLKNSQGRARHCTLRHAHCAYQPTSVQHTASVPRTAHTHIKTEVVCARAPQDSPCELNKHALQTHAHTAHRKCCTTRKVPHTHA